MSSNRHQTASLFRGILNDLKRRPEDASRDLEVDLSLIRGILDGTSTLTLEIIEKATQVWPVNARDFFPINDDTLNGVRIMRALDSKKSSRIMERGGSPYYEYRDTAMSSVAPFRPEWIAELCIVEDSKIDNPSVHWNKGHFMHQFTYFIGPVNFYYMTRSGEKCVAEMNTGDSMYISPFIPHTFATRKNPNNVSGLILALTYGDSVAGDAHHELAAIGVELGSRYFLNFQNKGAAFSSLVRYYCNLISLPEEIAAEMAEISKDRWSKIVSNEEEPTSAEISSIASALRVNARDLMPFDEFNSGVVLHKLNQSRLWRNGERYTCRELASPLNLPHSKALEIQIHSDSTELDQVAGGHGYVYNIGNTPIKLDWELDGNSYSETIEVDDSVYIKPFLRHGFRGKGGKILTLRIPGQLGGEAIRELSSIGSEYASRVISETMQWFDPKGDRK